VEVVALCYNSGVGTLYLVATPIGNLEDITLRALRILKEVHHIAAEDTRHTRKLLDHYDIDTPLLSYHEHNKLTRLNEVMELLDAGDVALVSDAGTPALSDPGYLLVQAALDAGHAVSPVPGPSAPVAALVASGLSSDSFLYVGYLPRKRAARRALLEALDDEPHTLLAFETPHRLLDALSDLESILGPNREIAVCRELTKVHEQILRGTIGEIHHRLRERVPRGEITLVIEGATASPRWDESRVRAALQERLAAGSTPSEAAREVASQAGWVRRDVYQLTLEDS
jgi:16S rRNA (cytidine1402-2'-O)-methyltransferase